MVPITQKTPDKIAASTQMPTKTLSTPPSVSVSSVIDKKEKSATVQASKIGQNEIQNPALKPVPEYENPKISGTVKAKADKPAEKPETKKFITTSDQTQKKAGKRVDEKVALQDVPSKKSETASRTGINHFNLHARLKAFLNDYCRTYEQKDLDKFSTFFALNAVEKGKPFRYWLSKYRQNFNRIDSLEYNIELERYATQEETGLVKIDGSYHVRAKLSGSKEWRKSSGQISMVLEADGGSFKVVELDY
jgi:hypothetical protein